VSAARAEWLPTVALFADQGTMGKDTDRMLGTYSYGVQLSLPIVDGFRRSARTDEERAREREAETRWKDSRLQAEIDVRAALIELDAARKRVTAAGVRLELGEQELAQARERFRAGVAGNGDVITASLSLNSARDLVVDAVSAYHVARVSLASAQGVVTGLP
jgi:outer membrane protein TolC